MSCGRTGCKKTPYNTPCCHESVYDEHNITYPVCSVEKCEMNYIRVDKVYLDYEGYLCSKYKQTFCSDCVCECNRGIEHRHSHQIGN